MTAAQIQPRMLSKEQAAAYCGLTAATFTARCPLPPVSMGTDRRLDRWDIRDLDEWLDIIKGKNPISDRPLTAADLRGKRHAHA